MFDVVDIETLVDKVSIMEVSSRNADDRWEVWMNEFRDEDGMDIAQITSFQGGI